ncbi:hypothetical protein U8V72_17575 [Priestia filamentosa]|uniref:hypothetical protein n=1 Tax=Priestia filamentosa TaxID=1402861 RepID=UPI0005890991
MEYIITNKSEINSQQWVTTSGINIGKYTEYTIDGIDIDTHRNLIGDIKRAKDLPLGVDFSEMNEQPLGDIGLIIGKYLNFKSAWNLPQVKVKKDAKVAGITALNCAKEVQTEFVDYLVELLKREKVEYVFATKINEEDKKEYNKELFNLLLERGFKEKRKPYDYLCGAYIKDVI